jgi:septin family protein
MTEAEFLQADERIHCVFYFMASHRMKEIDREFISQLSSIVPIIPIVGKADTMTVNERNSYMKQVKEKLDTISEKFGESCVYDFHGDDLAVETGSNTGLIRQPNIFAVVCDSTKERVYPWGTLSIDNSQHSDFRRLQIILFENGKNNKKSIIIFSTVINDL